MKIKLTKLKAKIKSITQAVSWFFIDLYGWHRSLFILAFMGIKSARVFYGMKHYWYSTKYAEKRARKWKAKWDQMGKLQGVFPVKERLLVCSQLEIKHFQKKKMIRRDINYRKMMARSSYYKSLLNYKK